MDTTIKDRILAFIAHNRLSVREFERRCGMSNGYVRSLVDRPSTEKIEAILNAFPDLNKVWLLAGEGAMLESDITDVEIMPTPTDGATPIYNLDATCGADGRSIEFLQEHIIGYVNMPNVSKSASLIRANGDSMTPTINDGDFIAVREVTDMDDIFYGQIYLVITAQNRMVKYVRRYAEDEANYVILRSANPEYDDIKMAKSKIVKMFMVENILSLQIRM